MSNYGVHATHCYQGEYETSCKYGDDDCPVKDKYVITYYTSNDNYGHYDEAHIVDDLTLEATKSLYKFYYRQSLGKYPEIDSLKIYKDVDISEELCPFEELNAEIEQQQKSFLQTLIENGRLS